MSDVYNVTATPTGYSTPQQFLLNVCAAISVAPCGQGAMAYQQDTTSGCCTALAGAPELSNLMPMANSATAANAGINMHMMGGAVAADGNTQAAHLYVYCDQTIDIPTLQYYMMSSES